MRGFVQRVDGDLSLLLVEQHHAALLTALWTRNAERLQRWEPWAAKDRDLTGAPEWIDYCLQRFAQGRHLYLLIVADGVPVGTCGLAISDSGRSAAIGYFVDASAEGFGYVTRAARWLVGEAERRGVEHLEIGAAVDNERSRAVAERLGFSLAAVEPGGLVFPGRAVDRALYGLRLPAG